MSDVVEPMIHEDALPGHESELKPKPDWEPRDEGSGRLKDKVAMVTGADSGIGRAACEVASHMTGQTLHTNGGTIVNG